MQIGTKVVKQTKMAVDQKDQQLSKRKEVLPPRQTDQANDNRITWKKASATMGEHGKPV